MTESKAKKELCAHIEYLKHNWKPHPDYDVLEAINIAINVLEKQIPKKPYCVEDKMWCCPVCYNNLLSKWIIYNIELMPKSNGLPYCLNCGQAIDWSDTD